MPYKGIHVDHIDFIALKEYYKGVGANTKSILTADFNFQDIFYARDNPPHILWYRFEIRITNAFSVIAKDARGQVHMDEMKLKLLNFKAKA